eukprot:4236683-Pleurochrysis_carterae.AAC.2
MKVAAFSRALLHICSSFAKHVRKVCTGDAADRTKDPLLSEVRPALSTTQSGSSRMWQLSHLQLQIQQRIGTRRAIDQPARSAWLAS